MSSTNGTCLRLSIFGESHGPAIGCVIDGLPAGEAFDLEEILPRPGHADYPGYVRYHGFGDVRGGGHFSGRLTAPLVFAGALCKQLLRRRGVAVGGHIAAIGGVEDRRFDPVAVSAEQLEALSRVPFSLLDPGESPSCARRWRQPGWQRTV